MGTSRRISLSLLTLVAVVGVSTSGASADSLESTYGQSLRELRHVVHIERSSDDLLLRVVRDIRNRGDRVAEAGLSVDLPNGAATIGLRSKHGNQWVPGRLLASGHASALYDRFTTSGRLASIGPTLMEWTDLGVQSISIFPIAPGKSVSVEYELRVPTCYQNGKRIAFYPKRIAEENAGDGQIAAPKLRLGKGLQGRVVSKTENLPSDLSELVDACLDQQVFESFSSLEENYLIVLDAQKDSLVQARFGAHNMGAQRSIGEVFVEIAPQLSKVPARAEVVFVLDMSFSQEERAIREQLNLVEGYLAHVPDARFQIVLARRHATTLFATFQSAAKVGSMLGALRSRLPARGNGSNLDVAAGLATTLFSSDTETPKRVVAFTDSRLRESLTPETLEKALATAPEVIAHVIDLGGGGSSEEFERDDDHRLAAAVMATGGMLGAVSSGGNRAETRQAMLSLVRPIQIDGVTIGEADPWRDVASIPDVVKEGFGFRRMAIFDDTPGPLTIRGKIWGREMTWVAKHDGAATQRIPALALGRELHSDLSKREVIALAEIGKTISPETSYLARMPGQRPSSYDYEGGHGGLSGTFGFSSGHSTSCIGIGGIGHAAKLPTIDEGMNWGAAIAGQLAERASSCAIRHSGGSLELSLVVETTGSEIVDVVVPGASSPYARCVVEAAWETPLGEPFERHNGRVVVELGR